MVRRGQTIVKCFSTFDSTGVQSDADALPTGKLYINGADSLEVVTITDIGTGEYSAETTIPLTAALEDSVEIRVEVVMDAATTHYYIWWDCILDDVATEDDIQGVYATLTPTAGAITVGKGTNVSGAYTDVFTDNGTAWVNKPDNPGGLEIILTFTLTATQITSLLRIDGFYNADPPTAGKYCDVLVYNPATAVYDQLTDALTRMNDSAADAPYSFVIPNNYKDTVTQEVLIKFLSPSTDTDDRLSLDLVNLIVSGGGLTADEIAESVWTHNISTHMSHDTAGFYASRTIIDHGEVVAVVGDTVEVDGLTSDVADLYNGLQVQFHDEVNDVYEIRTIMDHTVGGGNSFFELDRAPISALTTDWDVYVMGLSQTVSTSMTPQEVRDALELSSTGGKDPISDQIDDVDTAVANVDSDVWSFATRTLTSGGISGITDAVVAAVRAAMRATNLR